MAQRHVLALAYLLHPGHVRQVADESLVAVGADPGQLLQLRNVVVHVPRHGVVCRGYSAERQGVGELVLADVQGVEERRQVNVGGDAGDLGRPSVYAVEASGGDLHGAVPLRAHAHDGLHGALPMRPRVAEDDRSAGVLEVPGHDL